MTSFSQTVKPIARRHLLFATFKTVSPSDFRSVVRECQGPVLIEFTAKWSASGVIVEDFLKKLPPHIVRGIRFLRIDVEKNKPLAEEYGVSTIPTYLFIAHGEPVESVPGPMSGEELSRKLKLLCTEQQSQSADTGVSR